MICELAQGVPLCEFCGPVCTASHWGRLQWDPASKADKRAAGAETVPADNDLQPPRSVRIWEVFFAVRGSVIGVIAWKVAILTVLACAIVYWSRHNHVNPIANFGPEPFTFFGISISVFMSFRNSACYDRWWEAQGGAQWRQLIVSARSLAREMRGVVPAPDRQRILLGVCAYAKSLKARLRGLDETRAVEEWLGSGSDVPAWPNPTNQILDRIGEHCSRLAAQGIVSE